MSAALPGLEIKLKLHSDLELLPWAKKTKAGFGSGQGFSSDPLQSSSLSTAVTEGVLEMQPNISTGVLTVLGCSNKAPVTVVLEQGE